MDWYCSGINGSYDYSEGQQQLDQRGYVPEGFVTDEIREDLKKLGWTAVEWEDDE
jgi:hypothetical protein